LPTTWLPCRRNAVFCFEDPLVPIVISVEGIPLLREPIDRARREGEARGEKHGMAVLLDRRRRRFGSAVPRNLIEQLSALPPEAIVAMAVRISEARTIEDVLGDDLGRAQDLR
jgi:hypothetical protein